MMLASAPMELPRTRDAPTCSRFLYDRANQFIGESRADLHEKLLWLEEVLQEARKSFSKPEEVSLLPKTPSMKNKRKAKTRSRNQSSQDRKLSDVESNDELSPTDLEEKTAKRSKLSFVLEEDGGEGDNVFGDDKKNAENQSQTLKDLKGKKKTVKTQIKFYDDLSPDRSDAVPVAEPLVEEPSKAAAVNDDKQFEIVTAGAVSSSATNEPEEERPPAPPIVAPSGDETSPPSSDKIDASTPTESSTTQPPGSAVKEKIQKFQQLGSSDSSSEEGSSAKVSKAKHETRRLTSAMAAAFASPQHVMTTPRIAVETPPKPEPRLDLLAEVGGSDKLCGVESEGGATSPALADQQQPEKLPNLVVDDVALGKNDDRGGKSKDAADVCEIGDGRDVDEGNDDGDCGSAAISPSHGGPEEKPESNAAPDEEEGKRKSGRLSYRSRLTVGAKNLRLSTSARGGVPRVSVSGAHRRSSNARTVRRSSVRLSRSARDQKASQTAKWIKHIANLSDEEIESQLEVKRGDPHSSRSNVKSPNEKATAKEIHEKNVEKIDDVDGEEKKSQEVIHDGKHDGDLDADPDGGHEDVDGDDAEGGDDDDDEEEREESPPVRMTRTKARKKAEEEEQEEEEEEEEDDDDNDDEERDVVETPPQRCTRSKMRIPPAKDKPSDPPGLRAEMITPSAKSPTKSKVSKPLVTPVHSATASKTIRKIQEKLLSSSKSVSTQRTINLTSTTPSMARIPSYSKITTPSSATKFSSVTLTGTKFASGISSFINKKTTPSKTISPADEMRLREARLKEKEQKEAERQQRLKDKQEAELEEKRKKNKERQEKAEQMRLEREKIEAANRMKTAKTKNALLTLADKKKADKDKEEREKKKEQLRKAEMAEIKRSEEEAKRLAKQQQIIEEEKKKEEEQKKKTEEQEKERLKKLEDQRRQEEALRQEKQRVDRQEQERLRRQAEEKEKERQRHIELKKKEIERERIERQKVEMDKLRLKEAEKAAAAAAAAAKRKAEEDAAKLRMEEKPQPKLPVPNLNSTYEVNSAAAAAAASLNSTYHTGAKGLDSTYNAGAKAADATLEVAEHDASSYDMTPKRLPTPATVENYVIDDLASDDETDDEDNPRKKIPMWAEKQQLRPALVKQTYKPPNLALLFGVIEPPDLTQIFTKVVKKKYVRRGSSGIWDCPILPPGDYSEKS